MNQNTGVHRKLWNESGMDEDPKWRRGVDELFRYYIGGPIVDCGCGRRPSHPRAVTIDTYEGPDAWYPREVVAPHFVMGFEKLPFKDGTIGFITSIDSIEHTKYPIATLEEWVRCLMPGGRIAMLVPDPRYVPHGNRYQHGHENMWTPKQFMSTARMIDNIEIKRCEEYNEWWFIAVLEKVET